MIKIVITSPEVRNMKGIGKTSGKPYDMNFQTGYAFTQDKNTGLVAEFPDKFEFTLETGQAPYPKGNYTLSPSALYVGRDGHIEVTTRLVPLAAPRAAA